MKRKGSKKKNRRSATRMDFASLQARSEFPKGVENPISDVDDENPYELGDDYYSGEVADYEEMDKKKLYNINK